MIRNPREKRMSPRGENMVRYINESLLHNIRGDYADTYVNLPPLIERAYMVVNETGTILHRNFDNYGLAFRPRQ